MYGKVKIKRSDNWRSDVWANNTLIPNVSSLDLHMDSDSAPSLTLELFRKKSKWKLRAC